MISHGGLVSHHDIPIDWYLTMIFLLHQNMCLSNKVEQGHLEGIHHFPTIPNHDVGSLHM